MFEHGARGRGGRRGFVGKVIGGALAAGAAGAVPGTLLAEDRAEAAGDGFDLARRWEEEQGQEKQTWDMSWVDRVTGQYRQVFDAPEIAEGTVFHQARSFIRGYADVYGSKDSEFSAVMVLRHSAIPLVANDRLWDELEMGKEFKLKDPETGKPARRNPFLSASNPRGAKYSLIWPDGSMDGLMGRGAIALACNLALFRLVSMVAKKDKLEPKPARDKVLANLVPGVVVLPSGIFAVIRAEQAGCHYIRAS